MPTYTYELITDEFGEVVKRTDENGLVAWIPVAPGNPDYEAYLESLNA